MGDHENASPKKSDSETPVTALCEECKLNASKYKCPGCSFSSCSLPCVKAHKQRTGCTGKRHRTEFVPLSQFDDDVLLSDYNMLEDVKRAAESAHRMRVKLCGNFYFGLPPPLKYLGRAAANRKTRLLFLSSGMSKWETNRTFYNHRKKSITWTIEWQFYSTDAKLIDHGVHESSNIYSVIENHLKPGPWSHCLKQFSLEPLESLKFFIRKYPKGPKSPYRELDVNAPIREQLSNLVLIEYPVIHVFLPSQKPDFDVVNDIVPHKAELKECHSERQPGQEAGLFKEEIKEDDSLDTVVLDITKHREAINEGDRRKEFLQATKENACSNKGEGFPAIPNAAELGIFKQGDFGMDLDLDFDFNFDFEEVMVDAYPGIVSETNPNGYCDSGGAFCEGGVCASEGKGDQIDICKIFMEEELEDGEIPGF